MSNESLIPNIRNLVPGHWQEYTVQAHGIRQHLFRTGSAADAGKPPLILLHGFMSLGLSWLPVARELEADFDVIMPDARGHGHSSLPPEGYSIALVAADTAHLIQALGLERPGLVGHSNGALVAAQVAAEHPDMVRRVTLVDPPMPRQSRLDTSSPAFQAWRQSWVAWMESLKTLDHPQQVESYLAHQPPSMPRPSGARLALAVEAAAHLDLALIRDPNPAYPALALETIARMTCPVLLVTGSPTRGGQMNPELVQELAARPQWTYVHFEDAGHFVPDDQPARSIELVKEFNVQASAAPGTP